MTNPPRLGNLREWWPTTFMKIKIAVWVEGGVVQSIISSSPDIEVRLIDIDNKDRTEPDKEWDDLNKELPHYIY